jgi:KipI family sensor histidine kinase inhibitor
MTLSVPVGELRALGDRALLIGVADAAAGRALARALASAFEGTADVVCGTATVMVHATDPDAELRSLWDTAAGMLAGMPAGAVESRRQGHTAADAVAVEAGRLVTIPCRFDGPDLAEVAALGRCGPDDVVALLTAQPLTVAVVGFSPGFAYLGGLPAPLEGVPRRARPRPVVPAGSVAIANGHAAVYPTASPGGWNLVGRTGFPLFSPERRPFAVLAPGDRVRFTVAGAGEQVEPAPVTAPPWSVPPEARPVFEVVAPGLRAVVQDGGRRAVAPVGVPGADPADPVSFALANRLAGNSRDAGTLELTGGGTRLRCLGPCHVAAVGAAPDVRVDGTSAPQSQLLPLVAGQVLEVGRQRGGCRTYLSVAGGFLGPEWFGSSASDELTGLGAGPLVRGARLHAGPWAPPLGDHVRAGCGTDLAPGAPVHLRVVPGPHPEQFEPDALARLADAVFEVAPASNRVGLRLRAERGAERGAVQWGRRGGGELDSQGVVTGAVQVPPDGDPVVLLPDHATLGGYPVLAVVVSADHGLLGQCAPGITVRLVPTHPAAAEEARRATRRELGSAVVGPYPLAVD